MSSTSKKYTLSWNEHANNFALAFDDLLQGDGLVDVKLVAEGHLINAHRLVLSAMSPYFRNMFTQMPANQQAFVFLKDISKKTIIDLITYIYRGEVNVEQECLEEFMNTAHALNIKGLADCNYSQSFDSQQPNLMPAKPTYNNGSICQALQINHPFGSAGVQYQSVQRSSQSTQYQQPMNGSQKYVGLDTNKDDNEMNDNFDSNHEQSNDDENSNSNHSMDICENTLNRQWNDDYECGSSINDVKQTIYDETAPECTELHKESSDYNIIAHVRANQKGGEYLFYANNKFNKNGKPNANGKQRWICTKNSSQKCRAAASTMNINGHIMMKTLIAEHTHLN